MDDDLQNPPDQIPKLLGAIERGSDFVFGVPKKVQQNPLRVLGSKMTSWMAAFLFDKPRDLYPSSFMAVRYSVVKEIVRYDGPYPYIAGLLMRITRRGANVTTRHEPRRAGGLSIICASWWACGLLGLRISQSFHCAWRPFSDLPAHLRDCSLSRGLLSKVSSLAPL